MVIALFALSLVMIVGGVASVVQGFPYVRLESGLAMVISGATAASAGVILLGLAAVVQRLKQLQDAIEEAPTSVGMRMPTELPRDIPPLASSVPPVVAGAAGLAGLTVAAPVAAAASAPPEPTPLRVDPAERAGATPQLTEAEPPLPHVLPPGETVAAASEETASVPVEEEPASDEEDLFASIDDTPPLRSSLTDDAKAEGFTETPAAEPEETKTEEDGLKVVGTHSSGGNNYVMFANGSIQADTPRGRFTFNSLEELKAFVENGGESDARGAA